MTTAKLTCSVLAALLLLAAAPSVAGEPPHDGLHDFDFLYGHWKLTVRRLKNPLRGSHEWYDMTGTSWVRPIFGGKGNLDDFEADGPTGHVSALTIRSYSPEAHQWSIYWLNSKSGKIDVPTVGEFKNGRGEFYDQEVFDGRSILVRYIWSNITPKTAHFEQAFSPDGGKSWEVNWISDVTRVEEHATTYGAR
jgi:hypothetical protein